MPVRRAAVMLLALSLGATACGPKPPGGSGARTTKPGREARPATPPSAEPFLRALAKNPDDVAARLGLAAARREIRDFEGALLEAYKALASDPRSVEAHLERARIYFEHGLPGREIEAYRDALAIDPARVDVRENLGHALLADGQLQEAAAAYRAVLARKPDATVPLFNLARIVSDGGADPAEARQLWTRYLEVDPSSDWSRQAREALAALPAGSSPK